MKRFGWLEKFEIEIRDDLSCGQSLEDNGTEHITTGHFLVVHADGPISGWQFYLEKTVGVSGRVMGLSDHFATCASGENVHIRTSRSVSELGGSDPARNRSRLDPVPAREVSQCPNQ